MFNTILINREHLLHNIEQAKNNNPRSLMCAMVKANAYGVGMREVVETIGEKVDYFGVACFFEAERLASFTEKKILIVGALPDELDERFIYTCHSLDDIERLIKRDKTIRIHLKINSGMNRYGISSLAELDRILVRIKKSKLIFEGIFTHFATDDEYVEKQMTRFKRFISSCHKFGFYPLVHADNSVVNRKFNHHLDMVRIGFDLYNRSDNGFLPVVQIKSKVVQINNVQGGELVGYDYRCVAKTKMRVAVIPVGYADGFGLEYIGLELKINGELCKVLNVCMDCFMLDVSNTNLKKGDTIYLLNDINPLKIYAEIAGTSEYEVMTNFSNMRASRQLVSSSAHRENK